MNAAPSPSSLVCRAIYTRILAMHWLMLLAHAGPVFAGGEGRVTGQVTINGEAGTQAVVFLQRADGTPLTIAPTEQTIRQKDLRFDPDFVVVPTGTTVAFENLDQEIHNIHSRANANRFDTGAHMPETITRVMLKHPGAVPLRCRTHERMRGLIYVAASPYFAVTDGHGAFQINGVPAGAYRVQAWHPRLSPEEQARGSVNVTVAASAATLALQLSAQAPSGADLTDTADQDWLAVTDQIREQLLKAVALWKSSAITAATIRVTTTQSQLYGESGLRDAIAKRVSRERAAEHEQRMDQFRKRVQGLVETTDTEASLMRSVDEIVTSLRQDTEALSHPSSAQ